MSLTQSGSRLCLLGVTYNPDFENILSDLLELAGTQRTDLAKLARIGNADLLAAHQAIISFSVLASSMTS